MDSTFILDRMVRAVEKVRERLLRATRALGDAGVPYAVIGGNAVAAWVARVDEAAVRNTPDVDILLRRENLSVATEALEAVGFVFRQSAGITMFLDGPGAKDRDAVHVIFANEKVRPEYDEPAPDVTASEPSPDGLFRHLTLEAMVRMKLTSFRIKDRMHVRDMIDVGLVDDRWPARLPAPLADRLQQLLDDPDG